MEETKTAVRIFLSRFFHNREIGDEQDFFALGIVTSLFAMQLVQFVETRFNLTVENEDLDMENFKSIGAISRFVTSKLEAKVGA
jgi:methoxymalonate biosynthesis acyl carrier protein